MEQLKQTLLNYNLVIDNEYLQLYLDLLKQNLNNTKNDSTQQHHAIPVIYYRKLYKLPFERARLKANAYAEADPNNFIVNLKYTDHLLAHCYLTLCAKEDWFIFSCSNMLTLWTAGKTAEEILAMTSLDVYQKAYDKLVEQKHKQKLSDEHKAKIAKKHLAENMSEDYHLKLSLAMKKRWEDPDYRAAITANAKINGEKGREHLNRWNAEHPHGVTKDTIWINKNFINKRIAKGDLESYLAQGWIKGRAKQIKGE